MPPLSSLTVPERAPVVTVWASVGWAWAATRHSAVAKSQACLDEHCFISTLQISNVPREWRKDRGRSRRRPVEAITFLRRNPEARDANGMIPAAIDAPRGGPTSAFPSNDLRA